MKQLVQTLQLALEKEKTKVNDLKEQVGAPCFESCLLWFLKDPFTPENYNVILFIELWHTNSDTSCCGIFSYFILPYLQNYRYVKHTLALFSSSKMS